MGEIEDIAMKIFNAYEDYLLDKDKRKIFEDLFDRYLSAIDTEGNMEPYDAIVLLGRRSRSDFDKMVKTLRDHSLIPY